uniref:DUF1618 domain-containing protein n=1 Tax=Macrostomum lignano TaxID=282301 RepID=A0A1I8HIW6_9PLAT
PRRRPAGGLAPHQHAVCRLSSSASQGGSVSFSDSSAEEKKVARVLASIVCRFELSIWATGRNTCLQSVEEIGGLVRFRSQPFICEVLLQLDKSLATADWTLGLVQGCSRSSFVAQFEDACTLESCCCQPLAFGTFRMLNDGDGIQFPFVTHTNALIEVDKNTVLADQCQLLSYNCVFTPYSQIDVALTSRRHYLTRTAAPPGWWPWRRGTHTERHYHQRIKYLTFNPTWDRLYSLMTMRWDCAFQADLDYRRGGDTVVMFNESGADSPSICERPLPVFRSVLLGPALVDTQATVCYLDNTGQPAQLRQPPKYITVPWGIWQRQMQRDNSGLLLFGCQQDWEPRTWPIQQPNSLIGHHPEVLLIGPSASVPFGIRHSAFGHSAIRAFGYSVFGSFGIRSFGHSGIRSFGHSGIRSFGIRAFGHSVIRYSVIRDSSRPRFSVTRSAFSSKLRSKASLPSRPLFCFNRWLSLRNESRADLPLGVQLALVQQPHLLLAALALQLQLLDSVVKFQPLGIASPSQLVQISNELGVTLLLIRDRLLCLLASLGLAALHTHLFVAGNHELSVEFFLFHFLLLVFLFFFFLFLALLALDADLVEGRDHLIRRGRLGPLGLLVNFVDAVSLLPLLACRRWLARQLLGHPGRTLRSLAIGKCLGGRRLLAFFAVGSLGLAVFSRLACRHRLLAGAFSSFTGGRCLLAFGFGLTVALPIGRLRCRFAASSSFFAFGSCCFFASARSFRRRCFVRLLLIASFRCRISVGRLTFGLRLLLSGRCVANFTIILGFSLLPAARMRSQSLRRLLHFLLRRLVPLLPLLLPELRRPLLVGALAPPPPALEAQALSQ